MSVKGFFITGEVRRYDYDSLDNKPNDEGLSEAAKTAILQLAEKVAYIDENGQTYYQDLYDAFYGNYVNVTNTLTGCYSSNVATTTRQNAAYTATIFASPGYTLAGATVTITMGGTNVTGAYSNGVISIANVTGDLVITVTATTAVASLSAVYTQSGTVYDTMPLDSLKNDLVVTATYTDTSTGTVSASDYTLSGVLTSGTSTISVNYGGKSATFTVSVTASPVPSGYVTDGLVFFLDGKQNVSSSEWTDIVGAKTFALSDCTLATNGVSFNGTSSYGVLSGAVTNDWQHETIEVVFDGRETITSGAIFCQPWLTDNAGISMRFGNNNANQPRFAIVYDSDNHPFYYATLNQDKNRVSASVDRVIYNETAATNTYSTWYGRNISGNTYVGAGRGSGNITSFFKGKILAVRIYNRKLSQAEMVANQQIDSTYYSL